VALVAQRVAGLRVLEPMAAAMSARAHLCDFLALVGVHLEQAPMRSRLSLVLL